MTATPAPSVARQGTLDGMPRRLYLATPTRLMTWLECRRRYRFTYLERPSPPKGPPWAHNSLGASIHNALARWWKEPLERRTPARAAELVSFEWLTDGYRDLAQALSWRDRAADMVRAYVAQLDPNDEPLGVERKVAMIHAGVALEGRVDRIDERTTDDGQFELVIVDYKTGRHVLDMYDARASLALAVYAAAAARTLRRPCRRVELHHLPSGTVAVWEHTPYSIARHLGRAEEMAAECAAADEAFRAGLDAAGVDRVFPPNLSAACSYCDFVRQCPEGRAGGYVREPWSALQALPD
jgi:RecB family exonuclease